MSKRSIELAGAADLRLHAHLRLTGQHAPAAARESASSALRVLHDLASSPGSAADALALLHELQVYQVELELQDENLRNAVAELEMTLATQTQLYDEAPVGCFTLDHATAIRHLNLHGATLLGMAREDLLGRTLDGFLTPLAGEPLQMLLARLQTSGRREVGTARLAVADHSARTVQISVRSDAHSRQFLLAMMELETQVN